MTDKRRKAKPLDARTLRYVIRVLRNESRRSEALAKREAFGVTKAICEHHAFSERWMADVFAAKLRALKGGKS